MNLWITLSFLACLLSASKVLLLNTINFIDCDKSTIISIIYLLTGIFAFIWLLFNKKKVEQQKFDLKLISVVIIAAIVLFIYALLVMYALKITPNVSYSHAIINLNIIITILSSYFIFQQNLNLMTILGMLISLTGIIIMILYSNK